MFIEKTVFAKSYSAQLTRSRSGANGGFMSPAAVIAAGMSVAFSVLPLQLAVTDSII